MLQVRGGCVRSSLNLASKKFMAVVVHLTVQVVTRDVGTCQAGDDVI